MRTPILAYLLILFFGLIILLVGPWWWMPVVALLVGGFLRPSYPWALIVAAAMAGATVYGIGILWYGYLGGALPGQIASLFNLPNGFVLALVVMLVGAISTGVSAAVTSYLRVIIQGYKPPAVFGE